MSIQGLIGWPHIGSHIWTIHVSHSWSHIYLKVDQTCFICILKYDYTWVSKFDHILGLGARPTMNLEVDCPYILELTNTYGYYIAYIWSYDLESTSCIYLLCLDVMSLLNLSNVFLWKAKEEDCKVLLICVCILMCKT